MKKRVSIAGATGYSGGELTALLFKHPSAEIVGVFSSASGKETPFGRLHPSLRKSQGPPVLPLSAEAVLGASPDAVFLATPNEVSAEIAPVLLEAGIDQQDPVRPDRREDLDDVSDVDPELVERVGQLDGLPRLPRRGRCGLGDDRRGANRAERDDENESVKESGHTASVRE